MVTLGYPNTCTHKKTYSQHLFCVLVKAFCLILLWIITLFSSVLVSVYEQNTSGFLLLMTVFSICVFLFVSARSDILSACLDWVHVSHCLFLTQIWLNSLPGASQSSWRDASAPAFLRPSCRRNTESALQRRYQHTEEVRLCVVSHEHGHWLDAGGERQTKCVIEDVCEHKEKHRDVGVKEEKKFEREQEIEGAVVNKRWWLQMREVRSCVGNKLAKRPPPPPKIKKWKVVLRKKCKRSKWRDSSLLFKWARSL